VEKLPRRPFSGLSFESRYFECDTEVRHHEAGISLERGIFQDSPGSIFRPIHLVGNYELRFSVKGRNLLQDLGRSESIKGLSCIGFSNFTR
jgi:hypothetical protein